MPSNFNDDVVVVELLLDIEEGHQDSITNDESDVSANANEINGKDNVDVAYPDNCDVEPVEPIDLNPTDPGNKNALSDMTHDETVKKYDCSTNVNEIEKDFNKSTDKVSLFDTLNSLGKEHGWEQKVQDFAKTSIKDNIADKEFVTDVTNFGVKTFPQTMTNEIKEKVSNFVKTRVNPINEAYKEALIQAGEKSIEPIKNIMTQIDYDKPSSSKVVTIDRKSETQDKMAQIKPKVVESFTETIVGQGKYHEEDFNTILKNDITMSIFGDPDYNSDEESGFMPIGEEVHLVSKLEKEAERQIRIQNDFREALNPNIGLELNSMFSDHKHIMDTIARLRSDEIEIYNDSIVANHEKTLPPPEVLTYKYKGRIYKLVTMFKWHFLDNNIHLPTDERQKRVNKIQKFYLHLPPPAMLPMRKRLFNVMEIPTSCSPPKITKTALNLAIGGVSIGKSISPKRKTDSSSSSQTPGTSGIKDLRRNSDGNSGNVSTMAFIVPVMKKDYVLYNSAEARKKRANSNPLEIRRKGDSTPRISRLSCSVDIVGPSSPPTTPSSAPATPIRGKNLRISIRKINSEKDILNSQLSQSAPVGSLSPQRHVRFGFCEEIEYNELDEEFIDSQPYTPTDKVPTPCLKRPNRSCALEATPVLKRNAVLKFVTFCSSSKR